jgi:hypothetical protein
MLSLSVLEWRTTLYTNVNIIHLYICKQDLILVLNVYDLIYYCVRAWFKTHTTCLARSLWLRCLTYAITTLLAEKRSLSILPFVRIRRDNGNRYLP